MIKALQTTLLLPAVIALSALAGAAGAAQAADGDKCVKASDCRGFLPHICEVCADGKSACAHWACVHNACQTQTCPQK